MLEITEGKAGLLRVCFAQFSEKHGSRSEFIAVQVSHYGDIYLNDTHIYIFLHSTV